MRLLRVNPGYLILGCLLLHSAAPAALPQWALQKRGDFAFHYAARYTPAEMDWYRRFRVVVTGDFLPREQVRAFHQAGCKLLSYEWTVAFYKPEWKAPDAWERTLVRNHPGWLLNADKPLFGGTGASEIPAYYYDPTVPALRAWRVQRLLQAAREHHYDGVFFDTTGFTSVQSEAQQTFRTRYPGKLYDASVADFLRILKATAPDLLIFTNQGYRNAAYYLPYADYDLTESYMTSLAGPTAAAYVEGKGLSPITETYVHPWYDPHDLWNSVAHYCKVLINDPIHEHGYRTHVYHLNYGQPRYMPTGRSITQNGRAYPVFQPTLDREALYYSLAAALLMDQSSFFQPPSGVPADDVYFADLGRSLMADYAYDPKTQVAWRTFANGLVILNGSGQGRRLTFPVGSLRRGVAGLWDVYSGRPVSSFAATRSVTVPAASYPATRRTAPAGRVYLYVR